MKKSRSSSGDALPCNGADDGLMGREYAFQQVITEVLALSLTLDSLDVQMGKALELILSLPQIAVLGKGVVYLYSASVKKYSIIASRGFAEKETLPCQDVEPGDCFCGQACASGQVLFVDDADCKNQRVNPAPVRHGHYCVPMQHQGIVLGLINLYIQPGHRREESEEKCLLLVADTLAGIVHRHQVEEGRRHLESQLIKAEKMAALGRLAGRFAHELRNPLTVVGGLARRLYKNSMAGEKGVEYAGRIAGEVERLEKVLNNLLTMSQDEPPATEPHDINQVMEYLLGGVAERCRCQGVSISSHLTEVPHIHMDRHLVREAMENVLVNALDAMPQGGELRIATTARSLSGESAVMISIADSGEGMPADTVHRIFEPFFTSKGRERRAGLGLATTRKIVEDHNGTITVETQEGEGTTFTILLPTGPLVEHVTVPPPMMVNELADELAACDRELTILQGAVEHANEAFVTIDEESRIILFNKAAEALFGYSRQEANGRDLGMIIGGEMGARHHAAVQNYVRSGTGKLIGHEAEMQFVRRDGARVPVSISFSTARVGGQNYFTGIVRDLTETRALQEKAANAERLAVLGQIVAELSHEIKNPLVTIGGLARQLQRRETQAGAREKLAVIAGEVARLEELLAELRDLYRPRTLDLEQVDLAVLMEQIMTLTGAMAREKGVRQELEMSGQPVTVRADRQRLQQVLLNLQKNALEATPVGGRIVLAVANREDRVAIQVMDQGCGISDENLPRVFEPFFTTKKQGTGLGLSISKRIIEEHDGGALTVRGGRDGGAVFEIVLRR